MCEEDFENMLDQFCADPEPTTGTESREQVELVAADKTAKDDDVVMLFQSPTRAKTPELPAEPLPTAFSPPAPSGVDKVNENQPGMLSILDSSI
jgi:uncharacterized protein YfaQ (DUF2300 family)